VRFQLEDLGQWTPYGVIEVVDRINRLFESKYYHGRLAREFQGKRRRRVFEERLKSRVKRIA